MSWVGGGLQQAAYGAASGVGAAGDYLAETAGPVLREGLYSSGAWWGQTEEDLNSNDPQRQWSALAQIGEKSAVVASIAYAGASVLAGGEAAVVEGGGVAANRVAGNAFRDYWAELFRANGYGVETEVYKWTPLGRRFIDIEVSRGGEILGGIETKLGSSSYTAAQEFKDMWLRVMEH